MEIEYNAIANITLHSNFIVPGISATVAETNVPFSLWVFSI